jgi:hypothetical protein
MASLYRWPSIKFYHALRHKPQKPLPYIPNEGEAFRKVYFFSRPTLNTTTEAYVTETVLTTAS